MKPNVHSESVNYKFISLLLAVLLTTACTPEVRYATKDQPTVKSRSFSTDNHIKSDKSQLFSSDFNSWEYSNVRMRVMEECSRWIGTPYCYGGESRDCADCSGFVMEVFRAAGIELPRTAQQQFTFASIITEDELMPGDLVFFSNGSGIGHVGIYSGGGEMIHASSSIGVTRSSLSEVYYRSRFAGYGRVIQN